MRKVTLAVTTTMLGATVALGVPTPAVAAATDFGNACVATAPLTNATVLMTGRSAGNPLPVTSPQTGVITQVKILLPGGVPDTYPMKAKVARPTGALNTYTVLAESAVLNVTGGANTFPVRVPITAGDLLGLGGSTAVICSTASAGDTAAFIAGDQTAGSTTAYSAGTSVALPLVATVEPDADKDGFGDETQDKCPQSAASQGVCPTVKVSSSASAAGNKIRLLVTTDISAPVSVTGKAKVGGKTIKLKGGTKTIQPGSITDFTVRLPKALKAALAKLPPSKKITVTLTASATDVVGRITTHTTKVKLPGTR